MHIVLVEPEIPGNTGNIGTFMCSDRLSFAFSAAVRIFGRR